METFKTALVVVVLLAVLYGVYTVLNKPDPTPPPEIGWADQNAGPPQVEYALPSNGGFSTPATVGSPAGLSVPPPAAISPAASIPAAQPMEPSGSPDFPSSEGYSTRLSDDSMEAAPPPSYYEPSPPDSPAIAEPTSEPSPTVLPPVTAPVAVATENYAIGGGELDSAASDRADAVPASASAFDGAWKSAVEQVQNGRHGEALFTLSAFYGSPEVSGEARQRLVDLLDPLAGKVIYSTQHVLEPPYRVQGGENLYDIADRMQVPAQLLANINGIADAEGLTPGSELKVVRGPFRAEIDRQKNELVLFLGRYYAGRFAISLGNDPLLEAGEFTVLAKEQGQEYTATNGTRIAARAADNPYGQWWLDLGQGVAIHGSPAAIPQHGGLGCISLAETDAFDVFSILSVGSKVVVR